MTSITMQCNMGETLTGASLVTEADALERATGMKEYRLLSGAARGHQVKGKNCFPTFYDFLEAKIKIGLGIQ